MGRLRLSGDSADFLSRCNVTAQHILVERYSRPGVTQRYTQTQQSNGRTGLINEHSRETLVTPSPTTENNSRNHTLNYFASITFTPPSKPIPKLLHSFITHYTHKQTHPQPPLTKPTPPSQPPPSHKPTPHKTPPPSHSPPYSPPDPPTSSSPARSPPSPPSLPSPTTPPPHS